jgi:exodeoxyribonuclease I
MATPTFYWHDYETFTLNAQRAQVAQFAGVRTDAEFNIIAEPLVLYCQPALDSLPDPDSCLITGITPQIAKQQGVTEAELIRRIHHELSLPNTCSLGYNNLRFDDEVTRSLLYRNFYDPYAREWQNGCSRWDLIDVVRTAYALRPNGINWVYDDEGKPSLRLDQLTIANSISQEAAHDALADVHATIALAKLIKQTQPKLFNFLWQHRVKTKVLELLQLGSFQPVVHISGQYALQNYLAVVLPICQHPSNNNGVIVYDLSVNPEVLLNLSIEEIQHNIFSKLPDGTTRIPLKTVHINRCPVLAPMSVLRPEDITRLKLDLAACHANAAKLSNAIGLSEKLHAVFKTTLNNTTPDPDLAIYNGGFFDTADKKTMTIIRSLSPEQLATAVLRFDDTRLPEMLFRYRARNFANTLNSDERHCWQTFCRQRLTNEQQGGSITFTDYFACLTELKADSANQDIILALEEYGRDKMRILGLSV